MNLDDIKRDFIHFSGYSAEAYDLAIKHLHLVEEANIVTNITAIQGLKKAIYLHIYDSLLGLGALSEADEGPLLDLGSGAGYPGIPLAIFSKRKSVLIESSKKKAEILAGFIGKMGLRDEIEAKPIRAEQEAISNPNGYTALCARAVGSLVTLMELASPLLLTGGILIAYKGPKVDEELTAATSFLSTLGYRLERVENYTIPKFEAIRNIVVLRKESEATIKLPRADGRAQKRPLRREGNEQRAKLRYL